MKVAAVTLLLVFTSVGLSLTEHCMLLSVSPEKSWRHYSFGTSTFDTRIVSPFFSPVVFTGWPAWVFRYASCPLN
jgi:hypothetical protein